MCKGTPIRLSADFSVETLQTRRELHDVLKMMKGKILQPRILYLARLSFKFDGEIKSFTHRQKLKEFSSTKLGLQEMLKGLLYEEKVTTRNMKITKGKYTVKVVNQLHMKLVGRLKYESSKIIYIYNK